LSFQIGVERLRQSSSLNGRPRNQNEIVGHLVDASAAEMLSASGCAIAIPIKGGDAGTNLAVTIFSPEKTIGTVLSVSDPGTVGTASLIFMRHVFVGERGV